MEWRRVVWVRLCRALRPPALVDPAGLTPNRPSAPACHRSRARIRAQLSTTITSRHGGPRRALSLRPRPSRPRLSARPPPSCPRCQRSPPRRRLPRPSARGRTRPSRATTRSRSGASRGRRSGSRSRRSSRARGRQGPPCAASAQPGPPFPPSLLQAPFALARLAPCCVLMSLFLAERRAPARPQLCRRKCLAGAAYARAARDRQPAVRQPVFARPTTTTDTVPRQHPDQPASMGLVTSRPADGVRSSSYDGLRCVGRASLQRAFRAAAAAPPRQA